MQAETVVSTFLGVFVGILVTVLSGRFYVQRLVDRRLSEATNVTALLPVRSLVWGTAVVGTLLVLGVGLLLPNSAIAQATANWFVSQNGQDIFYDAGKVGIGLINPGASLHVASQVRNNPEAGIKLSDRNNNPGGTWRLVPSVKGYPRH